MSNKLKFVLCLISFYPKAKLFSFFYFSEECIDYPGCSEAFIAYEAERHLQGSSFCDRSDSKEMCPKLCSVCK